MGATIGMGLKRKMGEKEDKEGPENLGKQWGRRSGFSTKTTKIFSYDILVVT